MNPSQANIDQLIALAKRNICEGVSYEPRLWFDSITFPGNAGDPVLQRSNPNTFQNGEKYPVRITHLLFSIRPTGADEDSGDERVLQRYSARVNVQDTYYMNSGLEGTGVPIPLWQNVCSAASDTVCQSTSSWIFGRPYILGARDSMVVGLTLEEASSEGVRVCGASFSGYGLFSHRPYFFAGTAELTQGSVEVIVDPGSYVNDSGEPVVMTGMTLFCGAGADDSNPTGDIQQLRARIRQAESGTGQWWTSGPPMQPPLVGAMGPLWGSTTGRAIVHELPHVPGQDNPGWLFEPGMNAVVELFADDPLEAEDIAVAMSGYAIIT